MISKDFTVNDIHQIRYENFEKTKDMKTDELIEYTRSEAEKCKRLLEDVKEKSRTDKE